MIVFTEHCWIHEETIDSPGQVAAFGYQKLLITEGLLFTDR
jgi:hypothetical protein